MDSSYYNLMLEKDRMIPIEYKGHIEGIITYYIDNDITKFTRRENQWQYIKDNILGSKIYIDHLITHKSEITKRYALQIFYALMKMIKIRFPYVKQITWNRYNFKKGAVDVYTKNTV